MSVPGISGGENGEGQAAFSIKKRIVSGGIIYEGQ